MYRIISICISLVAICHLATAQQCPAPIPFDPKATLGTWQGALSVEGQLQTMTLTLSESDGALQASIDIPSNKQGKTLYQTRICKGQELHLQASLGLTNIEFIGKSPNGKSLAGKVLFRIGGALEAEEVFALTKTPL